MKSLTRKFKIQKKDKNSIYLEILGDVREKDTSRTKKTTNRRINGAPTKPRDEVYAGV